MVHWNASTPVAGRTVWRAVPTATLYVAQNGGAWGASGPAEPGVQVITDTRVDYLVEGLGAPNDLTFGPDGRLWITDTRGGIRHQHSRCRAARPRVCD